MTSPTLAAPGAVRTPAPMPHRATPAVAPALAALLAASALAAAPLAAQPAAGARVRKAVPPAPTRAAAPTPGESALPAELPLKHAPRPTVTAITAADLMTRVYVFADDSLMGREAGSEWNVRGTDIIARELARLGLEPAGDGGTFFQEPLVRRGLVAGSGIGAEGGAPLVFGTDFLPRDPGGPARAFDGAPIVYAGTWGDAALLGARETAGRVVVVATPRDPAGLPQWANLRGPITQRFAGAAAILVAALDGMPAPYREQLAQAPIAVRSAARATADTTAAPAFLYVTRAAAAGLLGAPLDRATPGAGGRVARGALRWEESTAPGRNVVAVLRGSDPALRETYVAIGAHDDHVGYDARAVDHDSLRAWNTVVRPQGADSPGRPATPAERARVSTLLDSLRRLRPARPDSIYNGADDDASGSMALLEIAENLAAMPVKPKRSILFIWHTGEELGMLGSSYFTAHPTVPRDSIVAQINVDMIGRGPRDVASAGPRYVQLLGSRRRSRAFGDLVEAVNAAQARPFQLDYAFDAPGHPEQYYCRSDHWAYARWGIPVVFLSTGGHRDYHQVTDEPQYLDYAHHAAVTTLIRDIAVRTANLAQPLVLDGPRPDPMAPCVQ